MQIATPAPAAAPVPAPSPPLGVLQGTEPPRDPLPIPSACLQLAWSGPRHPLDAPSLVPGGFGGSRATPAARLLRRSPRRRKGRARGGSEPSHPPLRTPGAARGSPRAARGRRGTGGPLTSRHRRCFWGLLTAWPAPHAAPCSNPRFYQAQSSSAGAPTASPQPPPAAFPPGVASPRLLAPGRCVRARRRHLGQARADAWLSRCLTTICFVSALPVAVALAGGWERVDNELVQTGLPSHVNSERKSEFVTL